MTTRRGLREAKTRRFRRVRAVLAGGLVFGVGAAATLASWTDQEYATATITAGTFSLVSRTIPGAFESHGTGNELNILLDATGLYPGQVRAALVQIQASGTVGGEVNLTAVSVTNSVNGALTGSDQILEQELTVGVAITNSLTDTPPSCTQTTVPDVTVTHVSTLPALAAQYLDPLNGNTVSYCIIVTMPTNADTGAQGGQIKPLWTFTGSTT